MKRLLISLCFMTQLAFAQNNTGNPGDKSIKDFSKNNAWENPIFFEEHKEKPRATFMLFGNKADVIADDYRRSPFFQSLNGNWKFVYIDKYKDRPMNFF